MKKLIAFLVVTAFVVGTLVVVNYQASTPPIVQPPPAINPKLEPPKPPTFEEAKNNITENNLRFTMSKLCSNEWEGRMSGKRGNIKAGEWIVGEFKLMTLTPHYQAFKIQNLNNHNETGTGETANVIAELPGGPRCIVIGAHFDHIGYGPSMSQSPNRREIHPGADDNASGTAALLEIAKAFSSLRGQNKHTVIFIAFSAEEMGLIGSTNYCKETSLSNVDCMINMDMIGRLKGKVEFLGANATPQFRAALKQLGSSATGTNGAGSGSDHAPFARRGIPVTFIHTGMHREYHTPDDTPDRINFTGLRDVARLVFHYCWLLDKEEKFERVKEVIPQDTWSDHEFTGQFSR